MEMNCPECMTPLNTTDGRTAVCPAHNAVFQILFTRYPLVPAAAIVVPGASGSQTVAARSTSALGAQIPLALTCSRHPQSQAVALCQLCRAPVCATCLFNMPGGLQLCPNCASNPNPKISSKRQRMIWGSMGLGIFAIIGLGSCIVLARQMHRRGDAETIGLAMFVVSLLPSIVGLAIGVGAFDRRLKVPATAWVGVVLNGLVLLLWFLLVMVGLMKK